MRLKIHNESPFPISYATAGASGLDLRANIGVERVIEPGQRWKIQTGIRVAIPEYHEGQVRGRSGLSLNSGVVAVPGTIDADYRGEIGVVLINHGKMPHTVLPGDRIAQLVIAPVVRAELEFVDDVSALGDTKRGAGGFGSTGR